MRLPLTLTLVLALSGCPTPTSPAVPIHLDKIVMSWASPGILAVKGLPGAVGAGATTLTVTVQRPDSAVPTPTIAPTPAKGPSPSLPPGIVTYRVQHLGSHVPIAAGYAVVDADGGFATVFQGAADRPVKSGDELDLTPQSGVQQVGYLVVVAIP